MPRSITSGTELINILSRIDAMCTIADIKTPERISNFLVDTDAVLVEPESEMQPFVLLDAENEAEDEEVVASGQPDVRGAENQVVKEDASFPEFLLNANELSVILTLFKKTFGQPGATVKNKKAELELLEKIFAIADADALMFFFKRGHTDVIYNQNEVCLRLQAEIFAKAIANLAEEDLTNVINAVIEQADARILEMALRASQKPALSVEELEELLQRAVSHPSNFSRMLIAIILQHLEAHPWWNNYALMFDSQSLWLQIVAEPTLVDSLRGIRSPQCIEAILRICSDIVSADNITRIAFNNVTESNRYDTYFSRRYIKNNGSDLAAAWAKQLPRQYENMPYLDPIQTKNLFKLFADENFVSAWVEDLDFNGLGFWLVGTQLVVDAELSQKLTNRISTLISELPDDLDEQTIMDLRKILDYLYADYNPFGQNKTLFKHIIGQLLQKCSVDSSVLEDLQIQEKYGRSFSYGITYAMHFCPRNLNEAKPGFFAALASINEKLQELNPLAVIPPKPHLD